MNIRFVPLICLALLVGGCTRQERFVKVVQQEDFKDCMGEVNDARHNPVSLPVTELFKEVPASIFSCEYVLGGVIHRPFSRGKLRFSNGELVRSGFGYALLDFAGEIKIDEFLELVVERFRDPKGRFEIILKHKTLQVNGDTLPITLIKVMSTRVPIKRNVAALSLYLFSQNGRNTYLFMWAQNYPLTEGKVAEHFGLMLQFVNEY